MGFSGKLLAEQRCRIGFGEQPGFEIETRRQVVIGVGGTREAIDAAMFASPIGIDRLAEGDVGGIVAADDGAGAFRSEDHTSELQSLMRISFAFFCFKKNIIFFSLFFLYFSF